ncbi:hypothetical protein Zm00014a_040391 [Zea mays]|uniref:Uncharacterized protein n=1 Tax=Zea mays TaxID=4577 RepID=A0A3L6FEJ2_MAIZE|nr:hypothetical protein Zm00014a_040391 [Zea mays]
MSRRRRPRAGGGAGGGAWWRWPLGFCGAAATRRRRRRPRRSGTKCPTLIPLTAATVGCDINVPGLKYAYPLSTGYVAKKYAQSRRLVGFGLAAGDRRPSLPHAARCAVASTPPSSRLPSSPAAAAPSSPLPATPGIDLLRPLL